MDCSPPGSSVHGILQARILEWVAISFSGDLPNPGIKPRSPALQADTLTSEPPGKPNPKERQCQRMLKLLHNCAHLTCYQVMLKILQARLQQYMYNELPDVQAGCRKGRGTRDQIANICWIIEIAREFQKIIYFCFF